MKFLIYDYSTPWNTEPLYFNESLNKLSHIGVESHIFDKNMSIFDNFDYVKPEVFITAIQHLNNDIISYLQNTPNRLFTLVINTNNANEKVIKELNSHLKSLPIKFLLFGTKKIEETKEYAQIMQCADIFSYSDTKLKFNINKLIFVDSKEDLVDYDNETYHYTSTNFDLKKDVDFMLTAAQFKSIYKNYDKIIFKDINYIGSQVAFDAIFSGTKVIFDTKEDSTDTLNHIFKGQKFLSSVKQHHTCLNRTKGLLSGLSLNDLAQEVNNLISMEVK
jgi:hypothetical protein